MNYAGIKPRIVMPRCSWVKRVGLTMRRSLPVFAHETTSSEPAWRRFVVRASRFCDRSARSVLLARISCSENPPKTRAWKPSNGGVLSLQKLVFRIHWSSEHFSRLCDTGRGQYRRYREQAAAGAGQTHRPLSREKSRPTIGRPVRATYPPFDSFF